MRFDKLTIKSQELIQNAQSLASSYNHQQIEPEHILSAMLNEPDGIARSMLNKLGVSGDDIFRELAAAIDRVPKVSGSAVGGCLHFSQDQKCSGCSIFRSCQNERPVCQHRTYPSGHI